LSFQVCQPVIVVDYSLAASVPGLRFTRPPPGYAEAMSEMDPETEATEADVAEQQQTLGDTATGEAPDPTIEADEGDVAEQRQQP
jgi:hypothetical protein